MYEHLMVVTAVLDTYVDWVRDVAWAPNTAMPYNIVATCSEDCCVLIWKQSEVKIFVTWDLDEEYVFCLDG